MRKKTWGVDIDGEKDLGKAEEVSVPLGWVGSTLYRDAMGWHMAPRDDQRRWNGMMDDRQGLFTDAG